MAVKLPILLSFYALSNGTTTLIFGQVTYTRLSDLSFIEYSRRKTFRTLMKLYRTRPFSNEIIELVFTNGQVEAATNRHGAFYIKANKADVQGRLVKVLMKSGEGVRMVEGLYGTSIHYIEGETIVISDIDDTLVHSFRGRAAHRKTAGRNGHHLEFYRCIGDGLFVALLLLPITEERGKEKNEDR